MAITIIAQAVCECCEELECESGSGYVSASSSGRVSLGVSVTDKRPVLTVASSGSMDLICAEYWNGGVHERDGGYCTVRCARPNAAFSAPGQLRIYVGGVLLSEGSDYDGTTSLRGAVTAKIQDSGYYDNCGGYSVGATVCPPDDYSDY